MNLAYVKVFADWTKATAKLKDAEKGRLIDAMVVYATTGEDQSDALSGNEQYLFPMFQASIDRDRRELDDYIQKQSENGKKGGRPRRNPPVFEENPKNPPVFGKTQKSQEKEKEKDKDNTPPISPSNGFTPDGGGGGSDESYIGAVIRGMTPTNWEELRSYMDDGLSMDIIRHAVDEGAANGVRTWAYVRRILDRYLRQGIQTLEQAKESDSKPAKQDSVIVANLPPWV